MAAADNRKLNGVMPAVLMLGLAPPAEFISCGGIGLSYNGAVEKLQEFITSTGGKILGIIFSVLVVIVIISWIDRHPSRKQQDPEVKAKEPPRDDE